MLANRSRRRMCALSLARGVRRRIEALSLGVALCATAIAQTTQYEWTALSLGGVVGGRPMTGIDDVDGDGVPDVLIGEALDSTLVEYAGRADIFSGRDGSLIRFIYGRATPQSFGSGTCRLDDIDGDGVEDFAIGAPYSQQALEKPYVRIVSGRTGALIREIEGPVVGLLFGGLMRPCPDVDGDGVRELLISARNGFYAFPGSGVRIVSPISGATLREFPAPPGPFDWGFGWSIDAIGDIDGDGITEIIIGCPFDAPPNQQTMSDTGSVRVYSAATGVQLAVYWGSFSGANLGWAVGGLGDIDSDGVPDVAVGSPAAVAQWQVLSRVDVRSGATGAVLYSISEPNKQQGRLIEAVGDQDADGITDFVVLSNGVSGYGGSSLNIVSGRTGTTLARLFSSPTLGIGLGVDAGDVNGDGQRDLLVPRFGGYPVSFRVQLALLGVDGPMVYCSAKPNSLGCVPAISSSGGASLSVGDNFTVSAINVLNNKPGVLLWSASALNAPFAGGTLCIAPASFSVRGPVLDSGGLVPPWHDCSGAYAFHFSHALMNSRGLTAGTTLYAQFISRDNGFAPPRDIGLTDALRFTVVH